MRAGCIWTKNNNSNNSNNNQRHNKVQQCPRAHQRTPQWGARMPFCGEHQRGAGRPPARALHPRVLQGAVPYGSQRGCPHEALSGEIVQAATTTPSSQVGGWPCGGCGATQATPTAAASNNTVFGNGCGAPPNTLAAAASNNTLCGGKRGTTPNTPPARSYSDTTTKFMVQEVDDANGARNPPR